MVSSIAVVTNPNAAERTCSPPDCLTAAGFAMAREQIMAWPGYRPTPLTGLPGLATELGIGQLLYKDESGRFGLGSFKALGGAYAVMRVLSRELARMGVAENAGIADFATRKYAEQISRMTVTSATDGNHGRSVAWGAKLFGCRAVIFIHASVSEGRRSAIARYGAEVLRVAGGYDDCVRHTFTEAERRGWHVVQDTATADYRTVPAEITFGYGLIAEEIIGELVEPPTHVIVPAGVGGVASAICARFWQVWGAKRPRFMTLEPRRADCVAASLAAGQPVTISGDLETVMAGLSCGEVSILAWDILATGADAAIVIDDALALEGMRRLASPVGRDPAIVAGECSGGVVGALIGLRQARDLAATLGIDRASRVLVIGTEGATDPDIYRRIVGRTPEEVAIA